MSIDSSMRTAYDVTDMQKTIHEIDVILQGWPFNGEMARQKIFEINASHPENVIIYNLIFSHGQTATPVAFAGDELLKDDLSWKRYYLNAKCTGKTVDEMQKEIFSEMRKSRWKK